MEIKISPMAAKIVLKINPFSKIKVMCLGYNEDQENFTELVWQDDKDLEFYDSETYPQFQIWWI